MKVNRAVTLAIALAMGLVAAGRAAFDMPVTEPVEVLQQAAAIGDSAAQYKLALAYLQGNGVARDPGRALDLFRRAAVAGLGLAQYNAAVMLSSGTDVPRDDKEAARWFFAAAQSGLFEAQTAMIKCYVAGRGVEKSPAKALAWDMIARRTLELRNGIPAGAPPAPGALRSDGAAEVTGKDGKKLWIHLDGSEETVDGSGVRHIKHKTGAKTTVWRDGAWETEYPNGVSEAATAGGRRTFSDAHGNSESYEIDGSHMVEGFGTTARGERVRVQDNYGPDGKRQTHRVISAESTYEERADGTHVVETNLTRDDGVAVTLTEQVDTEGKQAKGKLRRTDTGEGPKGGETWTVKRTLHLEGGVAVDVIEKYSESGLYGQEVVSRAQKEAPPSVLTVPPKTVTLTKGSPPPSSIVFIPPGSVVSSRSASAVMTRAAMGDDSTAFRQPNIDTELAALGKLEEESRFYAGATTAEYQKAQAAAKTYLIPLPQAQRAGATPAWLREKTISQATMHESPLITILDDRSSKVPFGVNGAVVIKLQPWKHAETEHFIIHYLGDAEARLTVQYIEGVYTVLTQLLDLDPQRGLTKSHVFIFSESAWKDYRERMSLPPQLAGFAFKTELMLGAAATRDDRAESTKVICHEVTHALVSRYYPGQRAPLWLNEGLAEYIALRTMRTKAEAASKKVDQRLLGKPDKQIDVTQLFTRVRYGNQTSPDRLSAFYANSQKSVQVLFEKLPAEGFAKFFNMMIAGYEPGVALEKAYGKQCESAAMFGAIVNAS